ncbi:MAG: fasciclin domain-containing protein [Bacteroidota bacterium]
MKKLRTYFGHLIMVSLVAMQVACNNDVDGVRTLQFDGTTDELLAERSDLSLFVEASERVGLSSRFVGSESFTFFAPDDDAFLVALNNAGFERLSDADDAFITALLNNHTVAGAVNSDALTKTTITTLGGETVAVSVEGGVFLNAKATVTDADNASDNGVVHVIDFPLIDFASQTITQLIAARAADAENPEFTILNAALQATGLDAALNSATANLTLFAPTDAAFEFNGLTLDSVAGAPVEDLTQILSYHVLSDRFFSLELADGRQFTLVGGSADGEQGLDFDVDTDEINITGLYEVATEDINLLVTNGAVHAVNEILLPNPFSVDAILFNSLGFVNLSPIIGNANERFFVGPITGVLNSTSVNVDSLFKTEEDRTIIAPFSIASGADEVLLGHTFEGVVDLNALGNGDKLESVNGSEYFIVSGDDDINYVNDEVRVVQVRDFFGCCPTDTRSIIENFTSYNGLVTLVLSEFTPLPAEDADDFVTEDSLSLFNNALKYFDLGGLSDVTYLYVENDAFVEAYEEAYDATDLSVDASALEDADFDGIEAALDSLSEDNTDVLLSILNRHIVSEFFVSRNLEEGSTFQDRNGEQLQFVEIEGSGDFGIFSINDGVVTVTEVVDADILANNAPIHTVNRLIPEPDTE